MSSDSQALLESMAARYIWWQTPAEALANPDRVIAQVMDLGTLADADQTEATLGHPALIAVLRHAAAGWFRPRSWSYWHYRLGLADARHSPPAPPTRQLPA